jgi:hypothetical protein
MATLSLLVFISGSSLGARTLGVLESVQSAGWSQDLIRFQHAPVPEHFSSCAEMTGVGDTSYAREVSFSRSSSPEVSCQDVLVV